MSRDLQDWYSSSSTTDIKMNNSTGSFSDQDNMQVPDAFRAAFTAVLFAVALLSVTGNILEIITFTKTRNLRTSANYYVTSMAVSDVLNVVSDCVRYSKSRLSVFEHSQSSFVCKLGFYVSYVSYSVSIASLVLISVDRFVATVFPMKVTMITARIRTVFILLTWVIPMGIFYPLFQFSRNAEEFERPHLCVINISKGEYTTIVYHTMNFVLFYIAPLIIITILNSRIMKSLRRTNPVIQENIHSSTTRRKRSQIVMKMLISINFVFFTCWTSSYAIAFLNQLFSKGAVKVYVLEILLLVGYFFLPFVSTAFNPVIIFTFSTNYRQGLKNCLAVAKCRSCFPIEREAREENVEPPELHVQ